MEPRYNEFNIEVVKKSNSPLIKIMKNSYEKKLKAQKEKERQEECKLLSSQTKGVNIVKEHILKRKREFLCHQRERMYLKQVKKKELEENILHKYKINLQNTNTRNKIVHTLINYDKSEKMKINTQKQRMKFIVEKLLTEIETKEKEKNKEISPPPKPKIIQKKVEPIELEDIMIEEELEEFESEMVVEEWEDIVVDKKKSKKTDSRKSKRAFDSRKSSRRLQSMASKPQEDPDAYKMPCIPILNPRIKYNNVSESKMIELIPPCKAMNAYLDDLKEFLAEMKTYPVDPQFSSKPQFLHFEDFENGNTYSRKLHIYNYSTDTAICSFERIVSDNEFCNVCLEIEDLGMQKLCPGRFYTLQITFRPKDMQHLQGKLVFLIRRIHDSEIKRFEVQVTCEIATIKFDINPKLVVFKTQPIWKARSSELTDSKKSIEIYNGMIYDCKLVIRRKMEPTSVFEKLSETESLCEIKASASTIRKYRKTKKSKMSSIGGLRIQREDPMVTYKYIENIVKSCVDYIDYIFHFDKYYFSEVPAKSSIHVKAYYRSLPHVGSFSETYELEFVSSTENILFTELVSLEAEATGKFILPEQEYLDFNTCMYNFIYQQSVRIFNRGTSRLKIGFLFPSKLKKYFSIYPATFFMKPVSHETVHIRFMPRTDIQQCKSKYFDMFTGILNFPVKICILAPRDLKVPPSYITVYSIITESDKLCIRFSDRNCTYLHVDNAPVLHLGVATTHETVTAEIEIENLSAITQEYGFLNLPEPIAIDPDYGFGTLNPSEIKTLKVMFSPTICDMITADKLHTYEPVDVNYKITCTTAYKLGEIKDKQISATKLRQKEALSMDNMCSSGHQVTPYYEVETDNDLFEYHEYLFEQEELEEMYKHEGDPFDSDFITKVEGADDIQDFQTVKKLTIIIKATIVDYWTEISHQNIIFPDTPLGSYSSMKFQFTAANNTSAFVDCVCGFIKKSKLPNFNCHFEIYGGDEGIIVEPICGDLKKNEHKQIYLIAKPSADSKSIFDFAQTMKEKGKSLTAMSNKKKSQLFKIGSKSNFEFDLYLAEKEVWKSIRPYDILANYVIVVNFTGDSYKSQEIIYLTVNCRVTKPQFVTNLNSQAINFGLVPVGTRPKKVIQIQNVSRHVIVPKIQLVSPNGPFICTTQYNLQLEKEFILKVPITFSPLEKEVYNEFFEIKSNNTTETVMVTGEGIEPIFRITPEFNVFRVFSKGSKFEDCVINFENKCGAPIVIDVVKTCELQGIVIPDPASRRSELRVAMESKRPDKKDKISSSNVSSGKKSKIEKMSLDLTPDEEYSLANAFKTHNGLSPFKIQESKGGDKAVQPFSKSTIKIRFEMPKVVEIIETSPDEKDKKSGASTDKKNKKKEKLVTYNLDKEYKYVAKYNIMMGNIILVKDLIIIGQFQ